MCLFNPEVLKQKVQDALLVLEASKEEETDVGSSASPKPTSEQHSFFNGSSESDIL
jgi:hypothetical protein